MSVPLALIIAMARPNALTLPDPTAVRATNRTTEVALVATAGGARTPVHPHMVARQEQSTDSAVK